VYAKQVFNKIVLGSATKYVEMESGIMKVVTMEISIIMTDARMFVLWNLVMNA